MSQSSEKKLSRTVDPFLVKMKEFYESKDRRSGTGYTIGKKNRR
jgi:hypothetical protein